VDHPQMLVCNEKTIQSRKIREYLISFLALHMAACSTFCCPLGKKLSAESKHKERLVIVILWKFISPIVNGYAATHN